MSDTDSALITGIGGQDGSFLAELLLDRDYRVIGLQRADGDGSLGLSEHLRDRLVLRRGDLLDPASLRDALSAERPTEIYHLAAPSFVPASWEDPGATLRTIVGSCASLLQAVREIDPDTRLFVAASGAIFGDSPESPRRESTPCLPTNPYSIAKLAAHRLVGAMRDHDGLHASSGILFNHESERRPEQFVTRRISRAAAAIALGLEESVKLGSLDAVRDWSYAGDIMIAAWLMLQRDTPGDYVLASGVGHTVAELARTAFACVDLDADAYVQVDSGLLREPERAASVGDPTKARTELGWRAEVGFEALVERMVRFDLRALEPLARAR